MKTLLKNELSKFIIMVLAGCFLCSVISFSMTQLISLNVKDNMFIIGLILTIGAIFSMIEGRPIGAEASLNAESKYIISDSLDVTKLDEDKLLTSVYIIDKVKSTLISTEFLTIGLITIIISYIF